MTVGEYFISIKTEKEAVLNSLFDENAEGIKIDIIAMHKTMLSDVGMVA